MRKHVIFFSLVLLTVLGLILRIAFQPEIPQGFHRDEAGIAYSAYSVLQTGKDEWGRVLPLHFKALGDYPPGIYNYLVAGSISLFGLTEFAERFPAVLLGTFLIPLVYVFVHKYFKRPWLALLSSFLVTFSPWDIVQSRAGSEALTALFFTLLGLILLKQWAERNSWKWFTAATVLFLLACFSYNSAKLATPLILISFTIYLWKELLVQQRRIIIGLVGLLLLITVSSVFSSRGRSMSFANTSVFTQDFSTQFQVSFIREGNSGIPSFVSRIFTNKIVTIFTSFTQNYFDYFTYSFLFNDGGFHKRYIIPKVGPLLLIGLPFLLLGAVVFRQKFSQKKQYWLLLSWLLIAPITAAITNTDEPNVKRTMYFFLPLLIFIAHGFISSYIWLKQKWQRVLLVGLTSLAFVWNFGFFAKQYVIHAAYETVHHRSYGYQQVFTLTEKLKADYGQVVVYEGVDTPHIFYLFYTKYPPARYQQLSVSQKRNLFQSNRPAVQLEEYLFEPEKCPTISDIVTNKLYVFASGCLNDNKLKTGVVELETINAPDGTPLFSLVEGE